MNLITVKDIIVPIVDGPIGITMSGGADSSLLLYLLMKNTNNLVHIYTLANNHRGRSNAIISANVIEKIVQLTNHSNIEHHIRYVSEQTTSNFSDFAKNAHALGIITAFYTGVTANPPKDIGDQFLGEKYNTQYILRDPQIHREVINDHIITPFTNINKRDIAEIYKNQDLVDTLYPLTRSCEIASKINYLGHCGNCWWCRERIWGFGYL